MEPALSLDEVKRKLAEEARAPRVTEESIKAKIVNVAYLQHEITTVCFITMENGFKFIGTSTPASPQNFNAEIGERYAYDNAFKQIWTHEGYLLRELLALTEKGNS